MRLSLIGRGVFIDNIMKFGKLLRRIEQLKTPLNSIMSDVISEDKMQDKIIALNQTQMFDEGVNADNVELPNYSQASVNFWGKRAGKIQMYNTGAFFNSMKVKVESDDFVISGDTLKDSYNYVGEDIKIDLEDKYGKLLGLTQDSKNELSYDIKKSFIQKFRQKTGF